MWSRLRRLDDQVGQLARPRSALADYIDAAERIGRQSYPPFEGAAEAATLEPAEPAKPTEPAESV
ncbi:hypothetical protein [Streptomyces sp. NRRL F-5755]|uniref:hypothetical protein n=1 Tax=Streptomyces sp. NRRL F-5755 TaxID=1519475 RepID=UPI000A498797|nr:hypothetical protein [Streptomyces sp. NRRL F-5755]